MGRKKIVISNKELIKSQKSINLACELVGGQGVLARKLGLKRQTINGWCLGKSRLNHDNAVDISKILNGKISPDDLEAKRTKLKII